MNKYEGTIAIGDVHGLTYWQEIVEKYPNHKIVFLGDYCDPYEWFEDEDVVDNMWNILSFKKMNMDRVVLLLGNHDMHYIYPTDDFGRGSRYNPMISNQLHSLFTNNRSLFQYAYQDGNCLYTHAGMSEEWFRNDFGWKDEVTAASLADIEKALNHPTPQQFKAMCQISLFRGGPSDFGGIFWADICELRHAVKGLRQIVGHNRTEDVRLVKPYDDDDQTLIAFCDCLRNKKCLLL